MSFSPIVIQYATSANIPAKLQIHSKISTLQGQPLVFFEQVQSKIIMDMFSILSYITIRNGCLRLYYSKTEYRNVNLPKGIRSFLQGKKVYNTDFVCDKWALSFSEGGVSYAGKVFIFREFLLAALIDTLNNASFFIASSGENESYLRANGMMAASAGYGGKGLGGAVSVFKNCLLGFSAPGVAFFVPFPTGIAAREYDTLNIAIIPNSGNHSNPISEKKPEDFMMVSQKYPPYFNISIACLPLVFEQNGEKFSLLYHWVPGQSQIIQ